MACAGEGDRGCEGVSEGVVGWVRGFFLRLECFLSFILLALQANRIILETKRSDLKGASSTDWLVYLSSAAAKQKTLIVPDKDADGLDAGVIIYRTLTALGLEDSLIDVHLVRKGASIHDEVERAAMKAKQPKYIVVVDQGSRPAPPVIDDLAARALIIDHHLSDEFPEGALVGMRSLWLLPQAE